MIMIKPLDYGIRFSKHVSRTASELWAKGIEERKCVLALISELCNVCERDTLKLKRINMLQFPWAEYYREIDF